MYIFKLRRDKSYRWAKLNPVLEDGEPGFESNTGRLKIGDGFKTWLELDYFTPDEPTDESNLTLPQHVNSPLPHPVYDEGPSLALLYENEKV